MALSDFPRFIRKNYEVHEWRHASAVLHTDFREEWDDIVAVLTKFRVQKSHITVGGGGRRKVSASIDRAFTQRGWRERSSPRRFVSTKAFTTVRRTKSTVSKTESGLNWNGITKPGFTMGMDLNRYQRYTEQMKTLIIEVSGGVVQEGYTDAKNLRVIKVDWDAGESLGDEFRVGDLPMQKMSALPAETREAIAHNI